jgi:hypothetical protein
MPGFAYLITLLRLYYIWLLNWLHAERDSRHGHVPLPSPWNWESVSTKVPRKTRPAGTWEDPALCRQPKGNGEKTRDDDAFEDFHAQEESEWPRLWVQGTPIPHHALKYRTQHLPLTFFCPFWISRKVHAWDWDRDAARLEALRRSGWARERQSQSTEGLRAEISLILILMPSRVRGLLRKKPQREIASGD